MFETNLKIDITIQNHGHTIYCVVNSVTTGKLLIQVSHPNIKAIADFLQLHIGEAIVEEVNREWQRNNTTK